MESDEISLEVAHHIIHVLLGHSRVDHETHWERGSRRVTGKRGGRGQIGVGEWEKREVPPDVVRVWIRPDLVFEPAGIDLIIIGGIAPAANAGRRVVKEGRIEHVLRVWMKIDELSPDAGRSQAGKYGDITYRPIPVRRRTRVIAPLNQRIFKVLKIVSVPWEEHARKMYLFFGLRTVKGQMTSNVP